MCLEGMLLEAYTAIDGVSTTPFMDAPSLCALCDYYGVGYADARVGVVNRDDAKFYVIVFQGATDAHCGLLLRRKFIEDGNLPESRFVNPSPMVMFDKTSPPAKTLKAPSPRNKDVAQKKPSPIPLLEKRKNPTDCVISAKEGAQNRLEEAKSIILQHHYSKKTTVQPSWIEEKWTKPHKDMPLGQVKCMFYSKFALFLKHTYRYVEKKNVNPEMFDIGLTIIRGLDFRRRQSISTHIYALWDLFEKQLHNVNHVSPKAILSEAKHVVGRLSDDFWTPKVVVIERVAKGVKDIEIAEKFKHIEPEAVTGTNEFSFFNTSMTS